MEYKNIFENKEFDTKLNAVKNKISNYVAEKKIDLGELDIDSLIGWHDMPTPRMLYASESCPSEIKNIVIEFIKEEFPLNNI